MNHESPGFSRGEEVKVMNDPSVFTGQKQITASIMVSYPPDATGAPAIEAGA